MKANLSVTSVFLVIALTVVAATYRVSTAPDRIRMRVNAAKESCVNSGGEWIKTDREEACLTAAERKKV